MESDQDQYPEVGSQAEPYCYPGSSSTFDLPIIRQRKPSRKRKELEDQPVGIRRKKAPIVVTTLPEEVEELGDIVVGATDHQLAGLEGEDDGSDFEQVRQLTEELLSSPSRSNKTLTWKEPMENALIDTLLDALDRGQRAAGSFKPQVWHKVIEAVKDVCQPHVRHLVNSHRCKVKANNLKRDHRDWREMMDQSGWGVDPITGLPTAPDDVMDEYFAVRSRSHLRKYRYTALRRWQDLDVLFDGVTARGRDATGLNDEFDGEDDNDSEELTIDESSSTTSNPAANYRRDAIENAARSVRSATKNSKKKVASEELGNIVAAALSEQNRLIAEEHRLIIEENRRLAEPSSIEKAITLLYEQDISDTDKILALPSLYDSSKALAWLRAPQGLQRRLLQAFIDEQSAKKGSQS